MSIVQLHLPGARVLDLYSGTGALGLEALSRGAASVDFVEKAVPVLRLLGENVESLGAGGEVTVHRGDAVAYARALAADAYDVAFADPPYADEAATGLAELWLATPFSGILSIEHASSMKLPGGGAARRYGTTTITFYGL